MSFENRKLYKLILIGHLWVNIPIFILCFGPLILVFNYFENILLKLLLSAVLFIIAIVVSWLYWSVMITKWRIWAFNQVHEDDWIMLRELAVDYKLIWEAGSFFEGTEIRNEKEKLEVNEINDRLFELEQVEEIRVDLLIPEIKGYRLSKIQNLAEIGAIIFLLTITIISLFLDVHFLGLILLPFLLYDIHKLNFFPKVFIQKDFLIFSKAGIQIGFSENGLIKWEEIVHYKIDKDLRTMTIYLQNEKTETVELWRLKISDYNFFNRTVNTFFYRFKS